MPSILNLSGVEGSYLQVLGILGIALGGAFMGYLVDNLVYLKLHFLFFNFCIFSFYIFMLYTSLKFGFGVYFVFDCLFLGGINVFAPILMSEVFRAKIRFSGISFLIILLMQFQAVLLRNSFLA